jgi:hypothetical protein
MMSEEFEITENTDAYAMDLDGDGMAETLAVDADGDGLMDAVGMDTNGDGTLDPVAVDDSSSKRDPFSYIDDGRRLS